MDATVKATVPVMFCLKSLPVVVNMQFSSHFLVTFLDRQFGFFERKTGYKYATVTQKNAETKVGTEKRQMYDEMYNYSPVPGENQPHQL